MRLSSCFLMGLLWMCGAANGFAAIEVIDDSGGVVRLHVPATRLVTLAPHLTEIVYAAGAGRKLVGTVRHADFPDAAKSVPRIGDGLQVNLESLLALRPDLILAWQSGNSPVLLRRLEELGLTVHRSESRTLDSVADTMAQIGTLTGHADYIAPVSLSYRRHLRALRQQYAQAERVRVFYQVWERPLMTVNNSHLIGQALALCGGENVFGDASASVPHVGLESVLAAQPAVIVQGAAGGGDAALQRFWGAHPAIPAVTNRHVYSVPADWVSRPGPRLLLGVQAICEVLAAAREGLPR